MTNKKVIKRNSASDIGIIDAICLIISFLTPCVLLIFDSSVRAFYYVKIAFILMLYLCALYKYIFQLTSFEERVVYGIFILFGTMINLFNDSTFYIVVFLSSVCYKNIKLSTIFKYGFRVMLIAFILTILAFFIFKFNYDKTLFQTSSSGRNTRYSLGFSHPNTAAALYNLIVLFYYSYKKKLNLSSFILFTVVEIAIYLLTDSRTGLLFYSIMMFTLFLNNFILFKKNWFYVIYIIFAVCFIGSFVLGAFFQNSWLNKLLSSRLYYINRVLHDSHNIKELLLGRTYNYPIDNYYVNLVFEQGIICALFCITCFVFTILICYKQFDKKSFSLFSMLTIALLIIGISENSLKMITSFIFIIPFVEFNSKNENKYFKQYIYKGYTSNIQEVLSFLILDHVEI